MKKYANEGPDAQRRGAIQAVVQLALTEGYNAQQIADALVGEPGFSRAQIDQYLNSVGLVSPEVWQGIVNSSLVSTVRSTLNGKNIDGTGIIVRVQEPSDAQHGVLVSQVVGDQAVGVAPGATIEMGFLNDLRQQGPTLSPTEQFWSEVEKTGLPAGDPQTLRTALQNMLTHTAAATLDEHAAAIQDITQNSNARVVNMSYGTTLVSFYDLAEAVVAAVPELKSAVFGGADVGRLKPEILQITHNAVLGNPEVDQAFHSYVMATEQAADGGKILVVAAGNSNEAITTAHEIGANVPEWAAFNTLAMSDHVISVGASTTNGTPGNVADDTMTYFSSSGADAFHPTVATQGSQAAVAYSTYVAWRAQPGSNFNGQGVSGTSLATPIVSGTVALMLQEDPNLTFAEVKTRLQAAAVDTAAPITAEGAGMLNVVEAVLG